MKKKRILAGIFVPLAMLCLVTSCGKDYENAHNDYAVKLNMVWWGNKVRNKRTLEVLEQYHQMDSRVTIEGKFFPVEDYWDKMAVYAAGKNMPDLCQMGYNYFAQYAGKDLLLDLTPYIENGVLDVSGIEEFVLDWGKVDDGIYGIAAGMNAECLVYNKTVTDQCGIVMEDNMTYDEFVKIAKKITELTGYRANICPVDGYTFMRQWSRAEGISVQKAQVPTDSADAYVPFFRILESGIEEGWHLVPDYGDMTVVETDPLVYGSIPRNMAWCTIHGGSNLLSAFQAAAPDGVEIGITTIPTSNPRKSNFLHPSMFFSVSADTENPDEAVAVLNYFINSFEANSILLGERGVPASIPVADMIADKIAKPEQEAADFVRNVIAPNSSPIDPPDPEGSIELAKALVKILEKVAYGDYTAEEAAQEYYDQQRKLWGE
ncbi:MAG: extracellular solute-binding protein [Lachnospiraceae bacterium]|nr:extracellular solute-binding protein [Lachnospiraceae bacterium]